MNYSSKKNNGIWNMAQKKIVKLHGNQSLITVPPRTLLMLAWLCTSVFKCVTGATLVECDLILGAAVYFCYFFHRLFWETRHFSNESLWLEGCLRGYEYLLVLQKTQARFRASTPDCWLKASAPMNLMLLWLLWLKCMHRHAHTHTYTHEHMHTQGDKERRRVGRKIKD